MARTDSTAPELVYWLPLDEAARRFQLSREALTAAVRRGDLAVRAKVVGGDFVASVCSTDLVACYGEPALGSATHRPAQEAAGRAAGGPVRSRDLELELARLSGRLETAERVERGLQRYADRLEERNERQREAYEERLAQTELVRLQLVRVVGRLEAELARWEARGAAPEPRALPAPTKRRRRWFGRRVRP